MSPLTTIETYRAITCFIPHGSPSTTFLFNAPTTIWYTSVHCAITYHRYPLPINDSHENVALNEAPMSSGFQYTGSVCNGRKPLGAGNTSMSQVDEESVVPVNSTTYTVTTPTITARSNAQPPLGHHNPQSILGSQNQTGGYDRINSMWDNYQPNPQYRNYPQVPTDPSNNISLTPIEVVSDILEANQCEQDI